MESVKSVLPGVGALTVESLQSVRSPPFYMSREGTEYIRERETRGVVRPPLGLSSPSSSSSVAGSISSRGLWSRGHGDVPVTTLHAPTL